MHLDVEERHVDPHRPRRRRRWARAVALLMAFALVAAACGDDDDADVATGGGATTGVVGPDGADGAGSAENDEGGVGDAAIPDLPAFEQGAALPGGTYGGTVRVAHWFPPLSLDPVTGSSGADHQVLYSMYDRLVHFDFQTLEFAPGLAQSWEFTDPQTLVFNLQQGVTFHDGTPFDAEAVAYNVNRVQNHPNSKVVTELEAVESVDVIDEHTVQFNLSRPDSGIVGVLSDRSGMMVSPTAAEAAPEQQLDAAPVGTGAFMLTDTQDYAAGERLTLTRFEDYWQEGLPYLDGIEWIFTGDEQSGLNGLRAGDVDVALTVRDGSQVADLEADSAIQLFQGPSLNTDGCYINIEQPPWDDVRVRTAFSMAIDRQTLANVLTFGLAEPAYQPVPPAHWAASAEMLGVNGYDAEQASALLEEAGQTGLTFTMASYQGPGQVRKAELLQQAAAEVGFNMELEVLELAAVVPATFTDKQYVMFCAPWTGRPDPGQTVASLLMSGGYYSPWEADPADIDQLAAEAVATDDLEERAAVYEELWQLAIGELAVWTPLWHNASLTATTDRVGGYQPNLLGKGQVQYVWLEE